MSDDLVKNLCSREDLNYPDEADVRKALKSSSGRPKDAIKLLRKQADKQPKRAPADSKASAAVGGAAGGAPVPAETAPAETAPAAASGGAPAPGAAAELLPVPAGSPVYSATRDVAVTPSLEIAPGAEQLGCRLRRADGAKQRRKRQSLRSRFVQDACHQLVCHTCNGPSLHQW